MPGVFQNGVPYHQRPGLLLAGLLFFVVVDVINLVAGEWFSAAAGVVIAGLFAWQLQRLRTGTHRG